MVRRPPRSTQSRSSAASDVYKRQGGDTQYPGAHKKGWLGRVEKGGGGEDCFACGACGFHDGRGVGTRQLLVRHGPKLPRLQGHKGSRELIQDGGALLAYRGARDRER